MEDREFIKTIANTIINRSIKVENFSGYYYIIPEQVTMSLLKKLDLGTVVALEETFITYILNYLETFKLYGIDFDTNGIIYNELEVVFES